MLSLGERIFSLLCRHPRKALACTAVAISLAGSGFTLLRADLSTESFLPRESPVRVERRRVVEIFGLRDPMIVALVAESPQGLFSPEGLAALRQLTDDVMGLEGVNPRRVLSIATEKNIRAEADTLIIEPFFREPPQSRVEAERIRAAVLHMPLYRNYLVSEDGRAAFVIAELVQGSRPTPELYRELLTLAAQVSRPELRAYVAGEGAVSGYLVSYVDADARRLNPLVVLVICAVLFAAYRTARGVALPLIVIVGTFAAALGGMAAVGVPFFVVTNGMVVILIGISVADGLHILGAYYEHAARDPAASPRTLVRQSLAEMWWPTVVTSVTTGAGFTALYFTSYMPPMKYFGLFSAVGVTAALLLTLTALPACLLLLRSQRSGVHRGAGQLPPDRYARAMTWLGRAVVPRRTLVLSVAAAVAAVGAIGAARVEVDEDWIRNFRPSEPIVAAHELFNRLTGGTSYLDVVFEAPAAGGLLDPARLRRIEGLQRRLAALPHVGGSNSVVDVLKQVNRSLHEDRPEAYRLPDSAEAVAQFLLLYSSIADTEDLDRLIDRDHRLANVRFWIDSGRYSEQRVIRAALERDLAEHFADRDLRVTASGNVTLNTHWMSKIADNHIRSLIFALSAVWIVAALSLRSLSAASLAVVPVLFSLLLVYAVMGYWGLWLGVGTSMFAAIAIGVGVDFSVHVIGRLQRRLRSPGVSLESALISLYPTCGRVLFFNFAAVALSFSLLMGSTVPPLMRFGALVAVAVSVAFAASVTVLPALILVLRPRCFAATSREESRPRAPGRDGSVSELARRNHCQGSPRGRYPTRSA